MCSLGNWGGKSLGGEGCIPVFGGKGKERKGKEVIQALWSDAELSCAGVACWDKEFPGITV